MLMVSGVVSWPGDWGYLTGQDTARVSATFVQPPRAWATCEAGIVFDTKTHRGLRPGSPSPRRWEQ